LTLATLEDGGAEAALVLGELVVGAIEDVRGRTAGAALDCGGDCGGLHDYGLGWHRVENVCMYI